TILRRYAASSIKFDDAKPAPIGEIKPGDQLRARGQRNADGSEITADEIVSGTFRNIAGILVSSDNAAGTITVTDLATKQPVTLRITSDSQLRKLQPFIAQAIAARLKGTPAGEQPDQMVLPLLLPHPSPGPVLPTRRTAAQVLAVAQVDKGREVAAATFNKCLLGCLRLRFPIL